MGQIKLFRKTISSTGEAIGCPAAYKIGEHLLIDAAALNAKMTGFWSENRWDMRNNPLGIYPKGRDSYRYIEFNCQNDSLNIELRYACYARFRSGKWSPRTACIAAHIHRIGRFLNEFPPPVRSFLDYSLAEWEMRLRTFLIERGEWHPRTVLEVDARQNQRQVTRGERCIEIFRVIYRELEQVYDSRPEFERDVWDLSRLGFSVNPARSGSKLNFTSIQSDWLREAAKKYVRKYLANRSATGAQTIVVAIACFSRFIAVMNLSNDVPKIDRQLLLDYISHLASLYPASNTRYAQITNLRTFLEVAAREKWLPISDHRLIYQDDLPRLVKCQPRYIPEFVMNQLENLIPHMKVPLRHLMMILKETGVRISELCTLELDCLIQDREGDYFLRYYQSKLRKEHSVPLSRETAAVIKTQRQTIIDSKSETKYLFPRPKEQPFKAKYFNRLLNEFAFAHKIADETGKLWHFEAHQFRHTVGTRLINAGVLQHFVQRFLGHESPEMTTRYAFIHDKTMKNIFEEYQSKRGSLIDIEGQTVTPSVPKTPASASAAAAATGAEKKAEAELLWFKKNIQAQALPNGYCALPAVQSGCPHANACLTCVNFRTDSSFLPEHKQQLAETKRLVQISRKNGWRRQEEMNERIENNLEKIISRIDAVENQVELHAKLEEKQLI